MSDAWIGFIGSVVVALLTLCGVIYQSRKNNNSILESIKFQSELSDQKLESKLAVHMAVTDEKISELTREVRAHNGHQERIALLESEEKRQNERIKALENRAS